VVMAPVIAIGDTHASILGLRPGDRIEPGHALSIRNELDPPAAMLNDGLPVACGRRASVSSSQASARLSSFLKWATR